MGQDQLDKFIQEQLGQHQSPIDSDALWKDIKAKQDDIIESVVKDKLTNHATPIDSQMIWNNIAKEVTGSSKLSTVKVVTVVLFCLGLAAMLIVHLMDRNSNDVSLENINNIVNVPKDVSTEGDINDIKIANSNTTGSRDLIEFDSKVINKETKTISTNSVSQSISNSDEIMNSNNEDYTANENLESSNTYNNSRLNNRGTQGYTYANQNSKSESLISKTEEANMALINRNVNESYSSNTILSLPYLITGSSLTLLSDRNRSPIDFLNGLPEKDECFSWNKSVECYDYSPKKLHFSILAYTTADYYSKSMTTNSQLSQSYLDNRKNTQKAQISNRSGLLVKLMHRKGLYLKVGAEAGFLRERFSHQTRDTITEIVPDQLIGIDIDMNGDTTKTYGNAPVTTISSKNWRVNNSHRTIGVPVMIGYEKKMSKFNLGLELGVLYNFHRSFEGWLLGPPEDPSDAKDFFSSNNDLNLIGGLNLNYNISERYKLVGIASFRQNMSAINNALVNDINQKNTTFGLGIGIEIKI